MKRFAALFLILCMLITGAPLSVAAGTTSSAPVSNEYVANEIIVMQNTAIKNAPALPLLHAEVVDADALMEDGVRVLKGTVTAGTDIEALCAALEQREDVLSASPNYIQSIESVEMPPEVTKTGSEYNAFNWYKDALQLPNAWQSADTLGSEDVVVAVLDTGVNITHKEFEGAIWEDENGNAGYNALNDSADVTDANGHGSNVAGIIAMRANDFGYVGIAPKVKIMPVKVSASITMSDAAILKGLNYAVEHGADIINMSFGSSRISDGMAVAYQRAATKAVLVGAAGNNGYDAAYIPQYPAACTGVIGVMSYGSYRAEDRTNYTINNGELSSFSNFDKTGKYYQIAAPGVEIAGPAHNSDTKFSFKTGTSQATPIVAGTAALYLSLHPDATPYQVRRAVAAGSDNTVHGYTDDTIYKGLSIAGVLAQEPVADETVNLSEPARNILNACMNTTIEHPTQGDIDALSEISAAMMGDIAENLSGIAELNGIQMLDLSGTNLTDAQAAALLQTSFPRLFRLEVSNNENLTALPFTADTAPVLKDLIADNCALNTTETFEHLPALTTLSVRGNHFFTSYQFEKLTSLHELDVSACRLQDVTVFGQMRDLEYLDVSENYICDISPLTGFGGSYLNISSNPLHLGNRQSYLPQEIENAMNDSHESAIRFLHDNLSPEDETYVRATQMAWQGLEIPRALESTTLTPTITAADATVNSACLFLSDCNTVSLDKFTGKMQWRAQDIAVPCEVPFTLFPVSGFPATVCTATITVPQVNEFTYTAGAYTLITNTAATAVKIGDITLNTYDSTENTHIFTVPASLNDTQTPTAVPYDSIGAGTAVPVGTVAEPETAEKASVLSFTSDKEDYFTGETAQLTITADTRTNYIKLHDSVLDTDTVLTTYKKAENGHIFTAQVTLNAARNYRFKAYASADGHFSIGAKVVAFTAHLAATRLKLTGDTGSALYFHGTDRALKLKTSLYPENAYAETIRFTSSDESIATVGEDGTVSAVNYGDCIITATTENGLQTMMPVKVSPAKISDPESYEGYVGEASEVTFYTRGATQLIVKNADDSDVTFPVETETNDSNIDGFDTCYTLYLYPDTAAPLYLKVYAADETGIGEQTLYKTVHLQPIAPVQSFDFTQSEYTFARSGGAVKIPLQLLPADSTEYFNWSISSSAVATLIGYPDYALLTPRKTGTVTLTASTMIDGEECAKSVKVHFTEGKLYEADSEKTQVDLYEEFNIHVKTDTSVRFLDVTDDNGLSEEYSDYPFYEDNGAYRYWTLPYHFKRESASLTVQGGDSLGNLSDSLTLAVTATMPASTFTANPATVRGKVGESVVCNLISLPTRTNINYSKYTVTAADESIAVFNLGNVHLLKEGETTLHFDYAGETRDVRVIVYAPVETITLPAESITMSKGDVYALQPELSPASAEPLFYESDAPTVATVDAAGNVTAHSAGTATVTVRSESGVKTTCKIKVKLAETIEALNFDKTLYTITAGDTLPYVLNANVATENKITYLTSNTNIVSVTDDGIYTAQKEGTVTITATADSGVSTTATVTVTAKRQLSLSRPYAECAVGNTLYISLITDPVGIDADGVWLSDNEQIATVNAQGMVTAKTAGTCNIWFVSDKGESTCTQLKVTSLAISRLSLISELEMQINENYLITYTKTSAKADERPVWRSADESIAMVDQNGFVYAVSSGNTTIFVSLKNGKTYTISVHVSSPQITLKAHSGTAATLTLNNIIGTSQTFAVNGDFLKEDFAGGTYTAVLTAPHHTKLTIEDAAIFRDTDLGELTLYNGDANGDGVVDIADISLLLQVGHYGASVAQAGTDLDINDNGTIEIGDIAEILNADNYGGSDTAITF